MIHDIKLNGPTNVKSYLELYNREINYPWPKKKERDKLPRQLQITTGGDDR